MKFFDKDLDSTNFLVKHLNISYDKVDSNGFPLMFKLQQENISEQALFEFIQQNGDDYHASEIIYTLNSSDRDFIKTNHEKVFF